MNEGTPDLGTCCNVVKVKVHLQNYYIIGLTISYTSYT